MIKIYTGCMSSDLKDIKVDIEFPENGLSPDEQVNWVFENWNKEISLKTFSPFILNTFNVIMRREHWTNENIEAHYLVDGYDSNIVMYTMEEGKPHEYVIDTYDTVEPMNRILAMYDSLENNVTDLPNNYQ